jgi:hypothetical protein
MSILRDQEYFGDGARTWNENHKLNPKRTVYLDAKVVDRVDTIAGIGPDGVYRDPFGNPYIITMDLNGDDRCRDSFYRLDAVSFKGPQPTQGLKGLSRASDEADSFEASKTVMAWSLGPDGLADPTVNANQGFNDDNILSWE